jgi:hypothetical protein
MPGLPQLPTIPNEQIFGLPLFYVIMVLVLAFIAFALLCALLWYWMKMGPCRGYTGAAMKGRSDIGFLVRHNNRASMVDPTFIYGVFEKIGIPFSWIQRSYEWFRFGVCNLKIFCDMTGISSEPYVQSEIGAFVKGWNDSELARSQQDEDEPALIYDYQDLYQMCKSGKDANGYEVEVPDIIRLHVTYTIQINIIQKFLLEIGNEDLEGHVATRTIEEQMAKKADYMPPMWFWVLVIMMIIGMVAYILMLKMG